MKTGIVVCVLAVAGVASSASAIGGAKARGVHMGPLMGSGWGAGGSPLGKDGPTIYSQPSESADGFFSDGVPGQFWSQRIADNFVLDNDYVVDGIRWWGSSENYLSNDLTNFKNFVIEFYDDAGGAPGASIGQVVVDKNNTNPTLTGAQNSGGGLEYLMETSLNLHLLGGVAYWVSVGSENVNPGDDGFVWSTNFTHGEGNIAADFFDGAGYQPLFVGSDQAFELTGAVPAPGAAAVLGLGGMLAARRRRA
jgi:hypothetical protein